MTPKLTQADIERLVKKSQKGDEKSFEKVFDAFFDKILRYVHFRVQESEVEDIVSDIFLKVVEKINSYKPKAKSSFNAWIFRIAHNTVIDFYRKKKELLGASDNEDEENNFFLRIPDEGPTPDEKTNQQFNMKRVHSILKTLPQNHKEILEFKYLEGFTNNEIAHITGKSEGNIRVMQLRALRDMRKKWEE